MRITFRSNRGPCKAPSTLSRFVGLAREVSSGSVRVKRFQFCDTRINKMAFNFAFGAKLIR